jgi:hypothetical protein
MKTLENLVLGVLFVCLIAACSKEEPKPCECDTAKNTSPEVPQTVDCSVPKTKKITVQAKLYIDAQGNISIDDYTENPFLIIHKVAICNQNDVKKILNNISGFTSGKTVTVEACESETYTNQNLQSFIFINILSVRQ